MAGTIDEVPMKGFRTPIPVDPKTGSPMWYSEVKSVNVSPIKDVKEAAVAQSMQEKFQKEMKKATMEMKMGKGRRRKTKKSKKSKRRTTRRR